MKKKIVILSAVLIVLAAPAFWLHSRQAVSFGGDNYIRQDALTYQADSNHSVQLRREANVTYAYLRLRGQDQTVTLTWDGDQVRIEHDDGTVIEGRWSEQSWLTDADGKPLFLSDEWGDERIVVTTSNLPEPPPGKLSISEALCRMDRGESEPMGHIGIVFIGILVYLIGAATILWPEQMFFFGSRWKFDYAELSDEGRIAQIFGGIIALIGGVALMYSFLFIQ